MIGRWMKMRDSKKLGSSAQTSHLVEALGERRSRQGLRVYGARVTSAETDGCLGGRTVSLTAVYKMDERQRLRRVKRSGGERESDVRRRLGNGLLGC